MGLRGLRSRDLVMEPAVSNLAVSNLAVTVLGCSGSYATVDNPCTSYLVRSPEAVVLLDCGPGSLGPLQSEVSLSELSAIVITHCHPDHWLELPVLRNVFTWFQPRSIPVYGTAETHTMDRALTVRGHGRADPLVWTEIDSDSDLMIADQRWRFSTTDHPVETLAVRVDVAGHSFAYSADTGPGWDFRALGVGIDLAMCDASHTCEHEDQNIPHMSARQAGRAAAVAGIDHLVLTHLVPGSDHDAHRAEAATTYGGSIDVARPGLTLQL